ncbi:hypothetical protein OIY81_1092 [Cryptosporidium canis]|nr:hypothetical protein OIY81_1092 [Cryptosporidium canis]
MHVDLSTDEYSIVEEEVVGSAKGKPVRSNHPNTGFPAVFNRGSLKEKSGGQSSGACRVDEVPAKEGQGADSSLVFNFSQNDILKLRWTSPIGEDESDWKSSGNSDTNLHNLRFNFDGILCDNTNSEKKCEQDDLYFYRGLHHHSDECEFEGYTIPELMHLSRSSNVSQRCIAIRTLGNIFLQIRQYQSSNHEFGKPYHGYLLGYLYGIHRWYKYLTGDLSIHYLLLNMLFHESYASRTAENSVISLSNLLTGGQFSTSPFKIGSSEAAQFKLLSYFLTPSEFIFELMDEKYAYYPSYFRNDIIYHRLRFFNQCIHEKSQKCRYNDLQDDLHLIKFDLPDGRSLELLRDTMQEIFSHIPAKYSSGDMSGHKNFLFTFLCKMAQNRGGTSESRISSINLIKLFIQRECMYEESICLETFEGMLTTLGDEMFDFSSSELASHDYSNCSMAKLLFSFLCLVGTYTQSLYIGGGETDSSRIMAQKGFLSDFLIKSVLPILRIVILAVLSPMGPEISGASEFIQLSLVEGVKIMGIMALRDIYLEDLSIYCKAIVHYFSYLDPSSPAHSFIGYYIFTLGCNVLLFSRGHEIVLEHEQYIQVLNQTIRKIQQKVNLVRESVSSDESKYFNALLLSVSMIRFQILIIERPNHNFTLEALEHYSDLLLFCKDYLEVHSRQSFDPDLLTIETGFLLEVEMGATSIQDVLTNKVYGEFYLIILISTFMKELSHICLLGEGAQETHSNIIKDLQPCFNLLLEMYRRLSVCYSTPNRCRTDNSDSDLQLTQLYKYELSYFDVLNMNDDQTTPLSSNIVKKNSIYLQALNSDILHICLYVYKERGCTGSKDTETGYSAIKSESKFTSKYQALISEVESHDSGINIPFESLCTLLFGSKNIEEYTLVVFCILRLGGHAPESVYDFYNRILSEYSPHLDVNGLLMFNPFIYSVNMVYDQVIGGVQALDSSKDPFLLSVMRNVLGPEQMSVISSTQISDLISFLPRYIFECSINQMVCISRKGDAEKSTMNFDSIGNTILGYLRLSLDIHGTLHPCGDGPISAEPAFKSYLLERICKLNNIKTQYNTTLYNINDKTDNECFGKVVDLLISAFCDSDLYFSIQLLDCFYFLFTFVLMEAISDSDTVIKILSNIKIMKFLLHNGGVDISCILSRLRLEHTKNSEISRNQEVVDLVSDILTLYRDSICQNTLSVFLVLYINNFSGSKEKLKEEITKLYEDTGIEYVGFILDNLKDANQASPL